MRRILHGPPYRANPGSGVHAIDWTEVRFTNNLCRETRDSVWPLVDACRSPARRWLLAQAASKHGVPEQELDRLKHVAFSANLDSALSILRQQGFVTSEMNTTDVTIPERKYLPVWLLILLVGQKFRKRTHAGPMLDLLHSHFPIVPVHLKPSLLVMATLSLARLQILSPLRRIVQLFLTDQSSYPELHFNLFLQAISRFPSSAEVVDQALILLAEMKNRNIPLRTETYDALLSDRFTTFRLMRILRLRMRRGGCVPTAAHLESFVRISAHHRKLSRARGHANEILSLVLKQHENGIDDKNSHDELLKSLRAVQPLILTAFRDNSASALWYLKQMLNHDPGGTSTVTTSIPCFSLSRKKVVGIYEWTAALSVAARDIRRVSAESLLELFQNARSRTTTFSPTVATYTVLLRGLLHRKAYTTAVDVWDTLVREGHVLDRKALTVGLQVLTRAGDPYRAFEALESYAAKPDENGEVPQQSPPGGSGAAQGHVDINTIVMNEFMVALLRIGRPDVVFKLWDHIETLYGVHPDSISLNILLKGARLSANLDDSFAGVMSQLRSRNPFRKHITQPSGRDDIVSDVKRMLVDPNGRSVGYRSVTWHDMPAWRWVANIFRQVVLGNWPHLADVRSPASAIRPSGKAAALHPMGELALWSSVPNSSTDGCGPSPQSPSPSYPLYPQIVPTDATFFLYVQLLGMQSLSYEIPVTLAWMRHLDIVPSTSTLAMALVFWAEVSLQAPWIERVIGERSEYAKLVEWIRSWVGDEGVPKEKDIGRWLEIIATMRRTHR